MGPETRLSPGGGVDAVAPGQDDWVVIVVELVREEEGAGKAVVLRPVMSVVFVRRNRVDAEAAVLVLVNGSLLWRRKRIGSP